MARFMLTKPTSNLIIKIVPLKPNPLKNGDCDDNNNINNDKQRQVTVTIETTTDKPGFSETLDKLKEISAEIKFFALYCFALMVLINLLLVCLYLIKNGEGGIFMTEIDPKQVTGTPNEIDHDVLNGSNFISAEEDIGIGVPMITNFPMTR